MIVRSILSVTFLLTSILVLASGQDSVTTLNVDDMFEVWFPNPPLKTEVNPVTSYTATSHDDINFMVEVTQFDDPKLQVKIRSIASDKHRKEFYLGLLQGIFDAEEQGSVIDKKFTYYKGHYVLDYGASLAKVDSSFVLDRVLLLGTTVYSFKLFGKQPLDELQVVADKWYEDIVFKEAAIAALENRNDGDEGLSVRTSMRLFGIVVSALVLALIIFFGIRSKKRRQSES
jgi:hypothetical protein